MVHTDKDQEESLAKILSKLEELGYVARTARAQAAVSAEADKPKLIAPHGGELVNRLVSDDARAALADKAKGLPSVQLDERTESDVELIAVGAFSPLKGFMNEKDYLRVVREMRLENGLPWSVPITLAVSEDDAKRIQPGKALALKAQDGRIVAVMEVTDTYRPDKEQEAREVYRTTEGKHPGVAYVKSTGPVYVGGEIQVLERPQHPYTRALGNSFPPLTGPRVRLEGISGSPPRLTDLPPGCRFAARCPHAMPVCREQAPALRYYPQHQSEAACHLLN